MPPINLSKLRQEFIHLVKHAVKAHGSDLEIQRQKLKKECLEGRKQKRILHKDWIAQISDLNKTYGYRFIGVNHPENTVFDYSEEQIEQKREIRRLLKKYYKANKDSPDAVKL